MTIKNLNWSTIGVSAGIGLFLGFFIHMFFHKCPNIPVVDNHLVDSLRTENTILLTKVNMRDSILVESEKRQALHDSIIINNHRALKKDYEKIKNFTSDSRAAYIDSILKRAGVRR